MQIKKSSIPSHGIFYATMIIIMIMLQSCVSTVHISSDAPICEKVDLISIGPKGIKEFKDVNLPYKLKVKDNNVPQLVMISSNSNTCIYDSIWIEVGSRNINENWAPPAIMLATLTLGIATPIVNYMLADVPSQKYYTTHSRSIDPSNNYLLDDLYKDFNLTLLTYQLLENDESKKAYSIANYMIKKSPSAEAYYLRGLANLKSGERKKALKDFKVALKQVNSNSQSWLIKEIYDNINLIENQRIQERKERLSSLGSSLLALSQAAINLYYQKDQSVFPRINNNLDNSLLDPQLAINQVKSQLYQEYTEFTKYNKKFDGSDYSFDEWMTIKGQAINDANSREGTTENYYNSNTIPSTQDSNKSYVPDCHSCRGSGKCNTCYGEHKYINPLTGIYVTCPNCKPDGKCQVCGGSGKKR